MIIDRLDNRGDIEIDIHDYYRIDNESEHFKVLMLSNSTIASILTKIGPKIPPQHSS